MQGTMLAGVYTGSPTIELIERPIPDVGKHQALLKVHACGICGTDLRILNAGHQRISKDVVRTLGHELSGEIIEVGSEVAWPAVGMRVSVAPNMGCGHCDHCVHGDTQLCPDYISFGVGLDGAFAEYMLLTEETMAQGNISEIPEHMGYEEAALAEPLACVYHGLTACRPKAGESVLVVGAGAIGLMFVQMAKALGAGHILVSSHSDERSETAASLGADFTFNPKKQDFVEAVMTFTRGKGVDIAIVAAPSGEAQSLAVEVLAHHGRVNFFGGLPRGKEMTPVNANLIHYRELNITGTTGSSIKDYRTTLGMIANHQIEVAGLVSHRFPLKDIEVAIDFARSKKGLKTMICPQER